MWRGKWMESPKDDNNENETKAGAGKRKFGS